MSNLSNTAEDHRSAEDRALDRFADLMIARIEGIREDWKKPWFTEGAVSWPKNLDGRDYNGMNALMLMMHCEKEGFKVPVFMTFDRVKGLNYQGGRKTGGVQAVDRQGNPLPEVSVNKGARSFPVFLTTFTVVDPDTHEKIKYDDYKQLSEDEKSRFKVFPKLNVFNVFNVDQTNLAESRPELYQKLQEANNVKRPEGMNGEGQTFSFPAVDEMIRENKWLCPIRPTYGDNAYYSISKDEIVVPEKKQFVDGESFYGTLFHEMTHSTGAESRLNRLAPTGFGTAEYAREELVAELGSALIAQRYGISKHIKEDSAAYLKNWLDSLRQSPDYIRTTLLDVKKASSMIVDAVEKVSLDLEQLKGREEKADDQERTVSEPDNVAARETVQMKQYAIFRSDFGNYVSYLDNSVVAFGNEDKALRFQTRDLARAAARECRYYMPGERFTVREVKGAAISVSQDVPQEVAQKAAPKSDNAPMKDLGSYDIPEWALNYMVNGDCEGLSEDEIGEVDRFVRENFPNGYLMQIDWNDRNEMNRFPAFGQRNPDAMVRHGESPYLAASTVSVQFRDPVQREEAPKTLGPDELGVISHPRREIWQVDLVGAYGSGDMKELRARAQQMHGVPSSEDGRFYFLREEDARRFNHVPGAFRAVDAAEGEAASHLTDLVVELRGEDRQPWISGRLDGEPLIAERLSAREFRDYMSDKATLTALGQAHFGSYLERTEEIRNQGISR